VGEVEEEKVSGEAKHRVALVGYRGTGKSTVAPLIAQRLGWSWLDLDPWIEQQAGCSVRELFEREGEEGFRRREAEALASALRGACLVLATGGGVVLRPENRQLLRQHAQVVWLVARPETIQERLAADPSSPSRRPSLTDLPWPEEIRLLLRQREPLYQEVAHLSIATDNCSPEEIADVVVSWLRVRGVGNPSR
jgi:shikimate kinase